MLFKKGFEMNFAAFSFRFYYYYYIYFFPNLIYRFLYLHISLTVFKVLFLDYIFCQICIHKMCFLATKIMDQNPLRTDLMDTTLKWKKVEIFVNIFNQILTRSL